MSVADGEPAAGARAVCSSVLLEAEGRTTGDAPPRRHRTHRGGMPGERRWFAWLFLLPAIVMLGAILLSPLIYSLVRSVFSDTSSGAAGSFVGLHNYGDIFTDSRS